MTVRDSRPTPTVRLPHIQRLRYRHRNVRIRRRPKQSPPTPVDAKPYRVTIHAAGDQHHTFAMGPGDGLGVGTIRIDIDPDGHIPARPDQAAAPS